MSEEGRCWYCGCELLAWPMNLDAKPDIRRFRVREHQEPRSRGGKVIVPACFSCNSRKGRRNVEEYRALIRGKHPEAIAAAAILEVLTNPYRPLEPDMRKRLSDLKLRLESMIPLVSFHGEKSE